MMTTLCGDSDFDRGIRRELHVRLGIGWDLEQRRCLDILGDEFGAGAHSQSELTHEPLFADVQTPNPGACRAA